MTTKEVHVLNFWYAKLSELNCDKGRYVSAGELARYVGQSTTTAKRYIKALLANKVIVWTKQRFPNGVYGKVYHIDEAR